MRVSQKVTHPRLGGCLPMSSLNRGVCLSMVFVLFAAALAAAAEPKESGWTTYRGNVQRTGNTDNLAGPTTPKVLWAFKAQEHFIASPVPHGDRCFVSARRGLNV